MRLWVIAAALLGIIVIPAAAHAVNASDIPSCAVPCLLSTLTTINCTIIDSTCMCNKASMMSRDMMPCLLQNCTMADTIAIAKLQATMCDNVPESRQSTLLAIAITAIVLEAIFVGLRVLTRWWIQKKMWADDWVLIAAMVPCVVGTAMVIVTTSAGLGLHIWQLNPANVSRVLSGFLISEVTYALIAGIVRISLLIFFLRTFPARYFQIAVKLLIADMAIHTLIFTFLIIFQCSPTAYAWDKTIRGGHCLDLKALTYAGAAFAAIHDVLTLAIPVNELSKLKLDRTKKMGVIVMFVLGSCGSIASFIRLKAINNFTNDINNDPDITWSSVDVTYWSQIEVSAIVVCTCIPSLRALVQRVTGEVSNKIGSRIGISSMGSANHHKKSNYYLQTNESHELTNSRGIEAASTDVLEPETISKT